MALVQTKFMKKLNIVENIDVSVLIAVRGIQRNMVGNQGVNDTFAMHAAAAFNPKSIWGVSNKQSSGRMYGVAKV